MNDNCDICGQPMADHPPTREMCKHCLSTNAVGFHVPDEVWSAAVPEKFLNSVVCIKCFAWLADRARVQWDRDIQFYPVSLVTHHSREP